MSDAESRRPPRLPDPRRHLGSPSILALQSILERYLINCASNHCGRDETGLRTPKQNVVRFDKTESFN